MEPGSERVPRHGDFDWFRSIKKGAHPYSYAKSKSQNLCAEELAPIIFFHPESWTFPGF